MPVGAMVTQSNSLLSASSTVRLVKERPEVVEMLGIRGRLADAAERVLSVDPEGIEYLRAMPVPVQEAIRAAIFDAITGRRGQAAKPVQISYMPAFEFGVSITDFGEALAVQVRGPYEPVSPGVNYVKARAKAKAAKPPRAKAAGRKVTRSKRKPARRRGR